MNPYIIFCTTCKNRTQHLEQTLPKNLADNSNYPACKFVVLDYNSEDHLRTYLSYSHKSDIASGRLVVYSMLPREDGYVYPFRMTHAKNMAHRLGILEGADILVNLDADNYTCPDFANYIAGQVDNNTYLWAKMVKGNFNRGISGRIVVSKNAFLNVGGYDEKCDTWWSDDKDFNARLGRLGYTGHEIAGQYLDAVPHNNKLRFKEYKHIETDTTEEDFKLPDSDSTVVNFGKFGEGTVFKNFDFTKSIELESVPTRIFGIGLHKTATTSLHTALSLLGYESAHWKSARWAKHIWEEITRTGKSRTLERSYAISDLPIPLIYKHLDHSYPGSKFILTLRDEIKWLDSVRRHWQPETNRFRDQWDADWFSHFIHKRIYGQTEFDALVFLQHYRQYNASVMYHFRSRPDDLLVLNVDAGHGWPELCRFLKRDVPGVGYPMENGVR